MPSPPPLIWPHSSIATWTWWRFRSPDSVATFQTLHNANLSGPLGDGLAWKNALLVNAIPKLRIMTSHDWTLDQVQIFSWHLSTLTCSRNFSLALSGTVPVNSMPAQFAGYCAPQIGPQWWRKQPRWHLPGVPESFLNSGVIASTYFTRVTNFFATIAPFHDWPGSPTLQYWSRKFNSIAVCALPVTLNRHLSNLRRRRPRADHLVWPIYPTV